MPADWSVSAQLEKEIYYQYVGGMAVLLSTGVDMMLDLISDEKTTQLIAMSSFGRACRE